MDIHNSIMDIPNSIMYIRDARYLWISIKQLWIYIIQFITHNYTLKLLYFQLLTLNAIMDMHVWIMDIQNWIMDVHNQILYICNSPILWIAMSESGIFMIDCVHT